MFRASSERDPFSKGGALRGLALENSSTLRSCLSWWLRKTLRLQLHPERSMRISSRMITPSTIQYWVKASREGKLGEIGKQVRPLKLSEQWLYEQSTGRLYLRGIVTEPFAVGYAGYGKHKNNPDSQCYKDLGPIPRGNYKLKGLIDKPAPFSIVLEPDAENQMCGRKNFLIHADGITDPGGASQGCIIIKERKKREDIWMLADQGKNRLAVVKGPK